MSNRLSLLLILLLGCQNLSFAQYELLHFIELRKDRGIPNATLLPEPVLFSTDQFDRINFIEQDMRGLVWLATNRGLFCFDGIFFRKIRHDPDGVSAIDNGLITSLFIDNEEKRLWIASEDGVSFYDLQKEVFTDYSFFTKKFSFIGDGECRDILKTRSGEIWFAVNYYGMIRLDSLQQTEFVKPQAHYPDIVREFDVYRVVQDQKMDSIFWLATAPIGLIRFNAETDSYTVVNHKNIPCGAAGIIFNYLFATPNKLYLGEKWANFNSYEYDIQTDTFRLLKDGLTVRPGPNGDILESGRSDIYWGKNKHGLFVMLISDHNNFACYAGHCKNDKTNLGLGMIWAASEEGLYQYDFGAYKVKNYVIPDSLSNNCLTSSVIENETGKGLYISFQGNKTILEYDRKGGVYKKIPLDTWDKEILRPSQHLFCLLDGRIYLTSPHGIYRLQNQQFVREEFNFEPDFTDSCNLSNPIIGKDNYVWFGTRFCWLYRVNMDTKEWYPISDGQMVPGVRFHFKDKDDNIWAANNALIVYHAEKDTIYRFSYDGNTNLTLRFSKGSEQSVDGNVYVSDYRVGGLLRMHPDSLDRGVLARYVGKKPTFEPFMYSLKADEKGRIWAVTAEGLQVFNPQTKAFYLFGKSSGFRLRDGENGRGLSPNLLPSFLTRLSSGEMLVAYKDGFAIFHPDSLLAQKEVSRPYLLSLRVNDQKYRGVTFSSYERIELAHDENMLEFTFSAVNWHESSKLGFAYRLTGVQNSWSEISQRSVRFVDLAPGDYTFELLAIGINGEQSEVPFQFHLLIHKPWWKTALAYFLYVLIASSIIWAIYQNQKRKWHLQATLEREHQEAERLKELDNFKSKFYTNITHEFRTPLTVILGIADEIKRKPASWLDNGLSLITRNAQNLYTLVQQMLDLSKLESGSLSILMKRGDIVLFLKYLLESFHSLAENKSISLRFQPEIAVLEMDYDTSKIKSIISNLLSNAIKFTEKGGEIRLAITSIRKPENGSELIRDFLQIKVIDNGIGIPKDELPLIFDRFHQGSTEKLFAASGTGIGLALTKGLVQFLEGEIEVESQLGEGTIFTVLLPIKHEAQKRGDLLGFPASPLKSTSQAPVPKFPHPEGLPHLLIVEDNEDVVTYLALLLESAYQLTIARDGEMGLEKAQKDIPDLIISDVMMPKMDGFELCKKLKSDLATSHIPIVLLTAKADQASRVSGLGHGADAYLAKPFNKEELFIRLEKLTELRISLHRYYRQPEFPHTPPIGHYSPENTFLRQTIQLMKTNFHRENFSLEEIWKEVGMSRPQFFPKFRSLVGIGPAEYLLEMRLHNAYKLLVQSEKPVAEVAASVGFKNASHFSRKFSEHFGYSPSSVRKNSK